MRSGCQRNGKPNFTLREEQFSDLTLPEELILLDLAVPRDIDPALGKRERNQTLRHGQLPFV